VPWRHVGEWRYSTTILDLSTGWRWVFIFMPWLLYPWRKSPQYSFDRRLGWVPEPVWTLGNGENFFPCWESNPSTLVYRLSWDIKWNIVINMWCCGEQCRMRFFHNILLLQIQSYNTFCSVGWITWIESYLLFCWNWFMCFLEFVCVHRKQRQELFGTQLLNPTCVWWHHPRKNPN
jgi:hypothetical protein